MRRVLITISSWTLALWSVTVISEPQSTKVWNFDADSTSAIAKGFTNDFGSWQVTADPSALSKPNALAQVAKSSNPEFNITLVGGTSFKDVDLSVKMKAVSGRIDQG